MNVIALILIGYHMFGCALNMFGSDPENDPRRRHHEQMMVLWLIGALEVK